jgi:hypothetical protein
MKITSLDRIEKVKMPMEGAKDAYKQVPISREDGAPSFYLTSCINTGMWLRTVRLS